MTDRTPPRVILIDLHTGPERRTYHIECVGPAYLAGEPFDYVVDLDDTAADDPISDDDCAWCGGPVRRAPAQREEPPR